MDSSKIAEAAYELRELSAAELAIIAGGTFIIGTGGGKVPPPPPSKGNVSHVRFLGPPVPGEAGKYSDGSSSKASARPAHNLGHVLSTVMDAASARVDAAFFLCKSQSHDVEHRRERSRGQAPI